MKYMTGNLFTVRGFDAKAITTNGFIKSNGEAVMGRGCALQAKRAWPELPRIIGQLNKKYGNKVFRLGSYGGYNEHRNRISYDLVSFPVKPKYAVFNGSNAVSHMEKKFTVGTIIPGWACKAELELVAKSAKELVALADANNWKSVLIPRPGCNNGELDWEKVDPILSEILDNRFCSITF